MNELMGLLEGRRTYRRFEQKEISREILEEILQAARLASSAANRQPLSYIVVQDREKGWCPATGGGAAQGRREAGALHRGGGEPGHQPGL